MNISLLGPVPFPMITADGGLKDGYLMSSASFCMQKCPDHVCRTFEPTLIEAEASCSTCPHGFTVIVARVHQEVLRIVGVLDTTSSSAASEFKRNHKHRKIRIGEAEAWFRALRSSLPLVHEAVRDEAKSTISALHDIKSIIGTILHTAENAISLQVGGSFDEKVESAPEYLRTIYHACRVLESLLQFTDIVANPESAFFGNAIRRRLHALLKLLVRVFEAKAAERDITILLRGSSYNQPLVLSSFIVIPVVLIDNAIKHSDNGSQVVVNVQDLNDGGVRIEFSSSGILVPDDDCQRIFDRGFRGGNTTAPGSGLGLHVAQHVARANSSRLSYERRPRPGFSDQGYNVFSLVVPGGDSSS